MKAVFSPSAPFGKVGAPPSKSMAHRYMICGALSEQSRVNNIAKSDDIEATARCLKALSSRVEFDKNSILLGGLLNGIKSSFTSADNEKKTVLDCGESGSTLRFLLPITLLFDMEITLTGSPRLLERGAGLYEKMCLDHGLYFKKSENGITVKGPLKAGTYTLNGGISSQYFSGMLFALSTLEGDSELKVEGVLQSRPYVELTIKALADFGIKTKRIPAGFFIAGGQKFLSQEKEVEGDWSNAAFLSALSEKVTVEGLDQNSLQGDRLYPQLFRNIGSYQIDLSNTPDLAPVLFAMAALKGKGDFVGTKRLKIKESDRSNAMKTELLKFGINTIVYDDRVVISGELRAPDSELFGHNDHRIVMALSVLTARVGGTINGAQAVNKSFPDFFEKIKQLSVKVNLIEA